MDTTTLILVVISIVSLTYGLLGIRIVFDMKYSKRVGDKFRRFYGVSSTGETDEEIYDRYTRGLPAVLLGFGLAFICIRALLG